MSVVTPSRAAVAPVREQASGEAAVGLAMLSLSAATLHFSAAVGHWSESVLYGVLFLGLAGFQAGWGAFTGTRGARRTALRLGIVINLGVLAAYVASRTVGLPVGPDLNNPETVGIADAVATVDEVLLIATAAACLTGRRFPVRPGLVGIAAAFVSLMAFVALSHVS